VLTKRTCHITLTRALRWAREGLLLSKGSGVQPFARGVNPLHYMALVASLLFLPISVHAQSDPTLKGYLLSVSSLYSALEYEQALEQISRAKRFARTAEDDVILSLYEGIILADMSRWDESTAAFKAALFVDPKAELPLEVSPKVKSRFEAVRQDVQRELANAKPSTRPQQPALPEGLSERPPPQEDIKRTPPTNNLVPPVASPKASGRRFTRPQVLIPAISGGVLMVAGGTSWVLSKRELSRLRSTDESLDTREAIHRSAARGSTYQAIGLGLVGAGLVGVGVATGLFFTAPTGRVALGISTNGSSAFVMGTWP